jgi:hypothetical protein
VVIYRRVGYSNLNDKFFLRDNKMSHFTHSLDKKCNQIFKIKDNEIRLKIENVEWISLSLIPGHRK